MAPRLGTVRRPRQSPHTVRIVGHIEARWDSRAAPKSRSTPPEQLNDGDVYTFTNVAPGAYTVTEQPAEGSLTEITCDDANSTVDLAACTANIALESNETVACIFVNTQDVDVIVLFKETLPAGGAGFNFELADSEGGVSNYSLDDGEVEVDVVDPIAYPITYTLTETVPTTYTLSGLACAIFGPNPGDLATVDGDLATGTVSFALTATGQTAFCAAQNTKLGSITMVKDADPADDTAFNFDGTLGSFTLQDPAAPSQAFPNLAAGIYTVTETLPQDWTSTQIACTSTNGASAFNVDQTGAQAVIDLGVGDDVTCTYANEEAGTISIVKSANIADGTPFYFSGDLGSFNLSSGENHQVTVPAGAYSVEEVTPTGWALASIQCTTAGGSSSKIDSANPSAVDITLTAGGSVECTFANEDQRGTVVVRKSVASGSSGPFGFEENIPNGAATFSLSANETQIFTSVVPGTYSVREVSLPSGSLRSNLACDDDNSTVDLSVGLATIKVEPNETVTCTFTSRGATARPADIYLPVLRLSTSTR